MSQPAAMTPGIARYHHWLPDMSHPTKPTVQPSAKQTTKRTRRRIEDLPAVRLVLTGQALVAALEVACEASHELLRVGSCSVWRLCQKVLGVAAS